MARAAGAILGLAVAVCCHGAALAYTASGDRNFPATLILPQLAPGDQFYLNYTMLPLSSHGAGTANRSTNFSATYGKTITDDFGIFLEETYTGIGIEGGGTQWGWQNL